MSARLDRIFSKETSNRGHYVKLCKELCVCCVCMLTSVFLDSDLLCTLGQFLLKLWAHPLAGLAKQTNSFPVPRVLRLQTALLAFMWVLMIRILVIALTQKGPYLLSHLSSSQNSQRTQYQDIKSSDRNMSQSPYQTLVNGIGKIRIHRDHHLPGLLWWLTLEINWIHLVW